MPKSFTIQDKQHINHRLMEKGKELFARFGIKKTTVEDITNAVAISKGSFYQFFDSKENLFEEIFEREVVDCRSRMAALLARYSEDPKKCIKLFIKGYIDQIKQNPFFEMTVLHNHNLPGLKCLVTDETIRRRGDEWIQLLIPYIRRWQGQGLLVDGRPEVIAATLRSTVYLLFHKNEIGCGMFPDIIELLSELISSGLLKGDRE